MLKAVLTLCLTTLLFSICLGQQANSTQGKVLFKANTEFSIQLDTPIFTDKNAVGDDVKFILNEDVTGEGDKLPKGSTVFGRIVSVEKTSAKSETAKVCIMFDFIKKGEDFVSLVAAIISVDPNPDAIKFNASPVFSDGTVLSLKGKEIQLDKGRMFRVKLTKDITAN